MNNILDLKPNIIIDNYEGEITLNSWKGFQNRQGLYGAKDSNESSDGKVMVTVDGKSVDYVYTTTIEQVNAIKYLIDNSDQIRDAILGRLLNELPELKEIYEDLIPEMNTVEDLKNYIGLASLHVMDTDKDGFAYIGFELGCEWDEEHGIGIMMHKDRVVEIGQADTSFDSWITCEDNGTAEAKISKWNEEEINLKSQKNKTSWWKFW